MSHEVTHRANGTAEMIAAILAAPDAVLAACAPRVCSMKRYDVRGPDAGGQFFATVVQITFTGIDRQEDLLHSRWFSTRRGADRWLNKQRVA